MRCPNCRVLFHSGRCPRCGNVHTPNISNGRQLSRKRIQNNKSIVLAKAS